MKKTNNWIDDNDILVTIVFMVSVEVYIGKIIMEIW